MTPVTDLYPIESRLADRAGTRDAPDGMSGAPVRGSRFPVCRGACGAVIRVARAAVGAGATGRCRQPAVRIVGGGSRRIGTNGRIGSEQRPGPLSFRFCAVQ
ncbi:hypothetical protein GCM10010297_19040 [Streptomyces malachitofuscus]|nr:hypothetical protein GCM10010297_19040 [Streptomyces malachitofuscus]